MRILFLDQFSELGGAQRCLADLISAVLDRGWSVTLALPGEGPFADLLSKLDIAVEFLPCGPYTSGRKTIRDAVRFAFDMRAQVQSIRHLIATHRVDLVYVNGPRFLPAAGIASGALPVIFHLHSYLSNWYAASLAGRQLRKPNLHVIASSHFTTKPLLRYIDSNRLTTIYNGTSGIQFKQRVFRIDQRWRIGVIGRIAPEKGQMEFVRAARILETGGLPAEYFVHGASMFAPPAYFESLRAASAGLPIQFTGWHDAVGPLLSELDLLIVPSPSHESTTRVVLEGFSAGTPVIAFATGGIPEVIRNGETGILVEPATPEALAAAIRNATRQPRILESIAIAARRKWEEEYTVARYQAQVIGAIEAAAGRGISTRNSSAAHNTSTPAISKTGP
jgi:glycosyltransferase involved in cell wall biosynthesis